jgi:hypothetical protein
LAGKKLRRNNSFPQFVSAFVSAPRAWKRSVQAQGSEIRGEQQTHWKRAINRKQSAVFPWVQQCLPIAEGAAATLLGETKT